MISLQSFKLNNVFSSWVSMCLLKPTQSAAKIVANFLLTSDIKDLIKKIKSNSHFVNTNF